jgi:hypothetical protein
MSLSTELDLNLVHSQQRTPELDNVLIVRRGDQFKLVPGFAFEQSEDRFPVFDVAFNVSLEGGAEWRHIPSLSFCHFAYSE